MKKTLTGLSQSMKNKHFYKSNTFSTKSTNFLKLIKGIYEKPLTNIILMGETLRAFPPRSE